MGTPRARPPDVHGRLALFGLLAVALGCGSVSEPITNSEPSPAPAPASGDGRAQSPNEAPPPASTEPAPSGGSGASNAPAACKVSFEKDLLPRLAATCAQSTCHAMQSNRPFIDVGSPKLSHEELMEFEFGSIEWSDPHSEYSGATEPGLKKVIGDWRMCGAPLD